MPDFIDTERWGRRNQFQLFRGYDNPHFNICAEVDVTALLAYTRQHALSPFITYHYLPTKTANAIEAFRYRIRGDAVVLHERVNASAIILLPDDNFTFVEFPYVSNFQEFHSSARALIDRTRSEPATFATLGAEDAIYHSVLPWISFTSLTHAWDARQINGAPRVTFGKFFERERQVRMPVSVQVHHALMDGLHVGRFYELLQDHCSNPQRSLQSLS